MTDRVDAVVVGAGVVGLAVARALAMDGREVLILEAERAIGSGVSSRNSEVIHAGLYYRPGSLKARLCVRGRELLYDYCASRGVPHRRCGKLVVAADEEQVPRLVSVLANARASGTDSLRMLDASAARQLEPALDVAAALHSPETGIIDGHAYMLALLGETEDHGAVLARDTRVDRVERRAGEWAVRLAGEDGAAVACATLVNAAGLGAHALATRIDGAPAPPRLHLAKGSYFAYAGVPPFRRLVYPLPEPGGLGVHLTLDLAGRARFGPDVEWVEEPDYRVDPGRAGAFAAAVRPWWPTLDAERLAVGYAGVRPKLSGPGEPAADFLVEGPDEHGLDGLVNLCGIESPGLTASLALAELVVDKLRDRAPETAAA